ncbi:VOC family protein [Taklimakanibacter lacteus]|uniref:VOC family protein n=1 Tax=Taklimakanibacter lacteus TaxID=2268456 RepID=UPI000E6739F9
MTELATTRIPILYPTLTYRDAARMIDWLERAFGFRKHVVYQGDDGKVMHAELSLGESLVMLGDAKDTTAFGKLVRPPGDVGTSTQSVYIAVPDADAVFATARAAGAEIVMGLTDQPYGSRDFICKDPEGHVWCFGTYAPRVGAAA